MTQKSGMQGSTACRYHCYCYVLLLLPQNCSGSKDRATRNFHGALTMPAAVAVRPLDTRTHHIRSDPFRHTPCRRSNLYCSSNQTLQDRRYKNTVHHRCKWHHRNSLDYSQSIPTGWDTRNCPNWTLTALLRREGEGRREGTNWK